MFELEKVHLSRRSSDAIQTHDSNTVEATIETDPAYGKYHWTGHRNCKVSLSPQEAKKFANICPVCHRRLTKGVEQRVEEFADRPLNFKFENAPAFAFVTIVRNNIRRFRETMCKKRSPG